MVLMKIELFTRVLNGVNNTGYYFKSSFLIKKLLENKKLFLRLYLE